MEQILLQGIQLEELLGKIRLIVEDIVKDSNSKTLEEKNTDRLITREEVCSMLKISLPTLNQWTKDRLLISYRISRRIYYKLSEVEEALTKRDFGKFERGI